MQIVSWIEFSHKLLAREALQCFARIQHEEEH